MKVKLLRTEGKGYFEEIDWEVPPLKPNQIQVKAIMTGVCRSDIDMMVGKFGPLPDHMQGHEGLGEVIAVNTEGSPKSVKVGDIVATRGEPAYADVYNCDAGNFVVVPEVHPKYILEPVACGINLVHEVNLPGIDDARIAIIGSGFLAWVVAHSLKRRFDNVFIEVISRSKRNLFNDMWWGSKAVIEHELSGRYDLIVDLSNETDYLNQDVFKPNAHLVIGSEKHPAAQMDFSRLIWNNVKATFPSPRAEGFGRIMRTARDWIESGDLSVDRFWTKGYNRDTEWRQAFSDGLNRPQDYSRGFIWWK